VSGKGSIARGAVQADLQRSVLVEAGHRCAIPTCRATTTEIAHIVPWARVKEHKFENLIALWPTCHARVHKGEIDGKALLQYKANLGLLNSRYGEFERRVLEYFAEHPFKDTLWVPAGTELLVWYLIKDGYLQEHEGDEVSAIRIGEIQTQTLYELTQAGREFVARFAHARALEQ
jgi:hypothetical protein